MGLLDDAIREHLELKRKHGADPTEVARQEREALGSGPVPPRPDLAAEEAPPAHEQPLPDAIPEPPVSDVPVRDDVEPDLDWSEPGSSDDSERTVAASEPAAGAPEDDVLEETPEFLQETPEHERLWFEQRPPKDFDF